MIGYLDEVVKPLVLILDKMNGYVKTFKDKDGNRDNKLLSFCMDDEKLLEKYNAIWIKIGDSKNIKVNALTVYDDRYIKLINECMAINFILILQFKCARSCRICIFYNNCY